MEVNIGIIRMIFDLIETMDEGLDYIEEKENEQSMKLELLEDLGLGIKSIEDSIEGMKEELISNEILEMGNKLIESINIVNEKKIIQDEDSFLLKKNYNIFKAELERCLKSYIMC